MRTLSAVVLALVLIPLVCSGISYAQCKEGQIDINKASLSELTTLKGIGPKKAQAIIDARPYSSVSALTRAKGIGAKTLANLRDQLCVGKEK